jgi:hypothetical protein
MSSARHAVIFADIFTGLGKVPAETLLHSVACENGRQGINVLCLTNPVLGNKPYVSQMLLFI